MEYFQYAVFLKKEPTGGYVVTCRDLPQLITQGESIEDALLEASDAMDEVFAAYMINNVKFPEPSPKKRGEYMVVPPAETMAKAALHTAMKEARVNHYAAKNLLLAPVSNSTSHVQPVEV
jgi:antitoxin HicB